MGRKAFLPFTLALLFTAFAVLSLLVILTKRHPFFVSKKLRLGAFILSLSSASVGCYTTSCYVPAEDNVIRIDQSAGWNGEITLNRAISDTITGVISARRQAAYSFAIVDSSMLVHVCDDVLPADGAFDEDTEEFTIGIEPELAVGSYFLRFYCVPKDSVKNAEWYDQSFSLTITDQPE